jgi:hypothetical protein
MEIILLTAFIGLVNYLLRFGFHISRLDTKIRS